MAAGRLSGSLKVTLTARTPLLIGGYGTPEVPDVPRRADGSPGTPMVPGSGLMGAVRSLHEALAGGCMRVLDSDWVPAHRHPASSAETADLRLAVVTEVGADGRALKVGLCAEPVVWVDQEVLPRPGGRVPRTGDRLRIPGGKAVDSGNRKVLRPAHVEPGEVVWLSGMTAAPSDTWVLLVTDTKARAPGKPVYFVAGRLAGGRSYDVPEGAWTAYLKTACGADDLRPANLPNRTEPEWGSCAAEYDPVAWPPEAGSPVIGERLKVRRYLHPGQPVWVRVADGEVTELRLSVLWRYRGEHTVGERAGGAKPCTDPVLLCWSCRVFGSADTTGRRDDDISRQRSYRGHVRVDDMLAAGEVRPVAWRLAPLAAPKPSAGQFYLDNSSVPERRKLAEKDTRPAATWGSVADDGHVRPIRGRKFYWRTVGPEQGPHPRGQRRHDQSDTQTRDVLLIPAGTVFEGRVCFENLSVADYGSLLAALDPRLLGKAGQDGWGEVVTSVGGGKPFGFGAVTIDVKADQVQTAAGRYLGRGGDDMPDERDAVAAFAAAVPQRVRAGWPALLHALTPGFVPDSLVWYPPGTQGAKGSAEFDRSFQFFSRTTGLRLSEKVRDLVVLPAADRPAGDQRLDSLAGERAIKGDERGGQPGRRARHERRGDRGRA
jgi:hypothetical protein